MLASMLAKRVEGCLGGQDIDLTPSLGSLIGGRAFLDCEVPVDLLPILERLTVVRLAPGSTSRWRIRQSGETEAFVEELTELILSKEGRVDHYLAVCDEVWLVIDTFGGDILQAVRRTAALVNHQYLTSFLRVFLVDTTESVVHQLWTGPPKVHD
jgi:hypothetical protein